MAPCKDYMRTLCWGASCAGGRRESSYLPMGTRKLNWQELARACCLRETCPRAALLQPQDHLGPWSRHLLWSEACPSCILALSRCLDPGVTACPILCSVLSLCTLKPAWPAALWDNFLLRSPHQPPCSPEWPFPRQLPRAKNAQALALDLPLSGLMTFSKLLDLSKPQSPPLRSGYDSHLARCCRGAQGSQ